MHRLRIAFMPIRKIQTRDFRCPDYVGLELTLEAPCLGMIKAVFWRRSRSDIARLNQPTENLLQPQERFDR